MVRRAGIAPTSCAVDYCATLGWPDVVQEFRCWFDAADRQRAPGASTRHVKEVSLRLVHSLQVSSVANGRDPISQRQQLVVARHDGAARNFSLCVSNWKFSR
jgi:hypothetical protein